MNFKVGDKVKIRTWEDMEKEFGVDCDGDIKCLEDFVTNMKHLCGRLATITGIDGKKIHLDFDDTTGRTDFKYSTDMIEPVNQTIVIYRKGAEVIALDKTTGNKAVAKCSPDDTFDFETGAKLAFEKLYAPKVKEVKRKAKVGEYVRIVNSNGGVNDEYKNGDILKIVKVDGVGDPYYKKEGLSKYLYDSEYVVLEGYEPPTEEKKGDEFLHKFKTGKTYVFRKEIHEKNLGHSYSWTEKVDGKVVSFRSENIGNIGDMRIKPEWCEELPFAIGDTVTVIDRGFTYSTYDTWKGLEGYKQNFVRHKHPITGNKYKLINLLEHERVNNRIIALIQDLDTTQVFIIGIEGIEKI